VPDFGRLGDERRILGLFGVGLHGDRLVADALNLIDAMRLGKRAAGSVGRIWRLAACAAGRELLIVMGHPSALPG
jgi:hypothetical protein